MPRSDKFQPSLILNGFIIMALSVEYSIVMPSLLTYVSHLHGRNFAFAVALSIFSVTSAVSRPIAGALSDVCSFRLILSCTLCLVLVGNVLYGSAWGFQSLSLLIAGRALAGIGGANIDLAMAYAARVTSYRERTKWIMRMQIPRMLGMVFGPAFQLLFSFLGNPLGPEKLAPSSLFGIPNFTPEAEASALSSYFNMITAPGFFMCAWTSLLLIAVRVILVEPPTRRSRPRTESNTNATAHSIGSVLEEAKRNVSASSGSDAGLSYPAAGGVRSGIYTPVHAHVHMSPPRPSHPRDLVDMRIFMEIMAVQWCSYFFLGSFETVITPVSLEVFHWGPMTNSIIFALMSLSLIGGAKVAELVAGRYDDGTIVFAGLLMQASGCGAAILCWTRDMSTWVFYVTCCFLTFTVPFVHSGSISLYSKLSRPEYMGRNQGLLSVFGLTGQILGPFWASGTTGDFGRYLVLVSFALHILLALICAILALRWVRLKLEFPQEDAENQQHLFSGLDIHGTTPGSPTGLLDHDSDLTSERKAARGRLEHVQQVFKRGTNVISSEAHNGEWSAPVLPRPFSQTSRRYGSFDETEKRQPNTTAKEVKKKIFTFREEKDGGMIVRETHVAGARADAPSDCEIVPCSPPVPRRSGAQATAKAASVATTAMEGDGNKKSKRTAPEIDGETEPNPEALEAETQTSDGVLNEPLLALSPLSLGTEASVSTPAGGSRNVKKRRQWKRKKSGASEEKTNKEHYLYEPSLYYVFSRFDKDNDGYLSRHEFAELYESLAKTGDKVVKTVCHKMKWSQSLRIEYADFCEMVRKCYPDLSLSLLTPDFAALQQDSTGTIGVADAVQITLKSREFVEQHFDRADTDQDGFVTLIEYKQLMQTFYERYGVRLNEEMVRSYMDQKNVLRQLSSALSSPVANDLKSPPVIQRLLSNHSDAKSR
eukprot:CAMPEP_0184498866 /NCGR_PEP_ID=MMETSP0113_2-20130426/40077_1 /TAXON_ID=91329 /ORGANISM="Norrisiella sphaerica, Strain BC52" /LENGTH=934 /DNA_ID=CAMNT_0026886567 /DNA_START=160 /DNA_END=2964 /DNA_ORIENTATION=+